MNDKVVMRAKEIIEKIQYITIATVGADCTPWNSPVYAAHDAEYTFYWASWEESQHSRNIKKNNNVFLVVYDSTVPEGTGEGVYLQAKAYEITDKEEILRALLHLNKKKISPKKAEEFRGNYPRRIYKAVPEKVWMNVDGDIEGNFVDKRVEVDLLGSKKD